MAYFSWTKGGTLSFFFNFFIIPWTIVQLPWDKKWRKIIIFVSFFPFFSDCFFNFFSKFLNTIIDEKYNLLVWFWLKKTHFLSQNTIFSYNFDFCSFLIFVCLISTKTKNINSKGRRYVKYLFSWKSKTHHNSFVF